MNIELHTTDKKQRNRHSGSDNFHTFWLGARVEEFPKRVSEVLEMYRGPWTRKAQRSDSRGLG